MRANRIVIAGAAALLLLAGGTAAGASIASPTDSSGVIHGCWTNAEVGGTHAFVLQDAGTSCPKGTTAISWNQTGIQGPQGPQGATGATGPQGPKGDPGTTGATGQQGPPGPVGAQGQQGLPGAQGAAGANGTNGNTVLNGSGAPLDTLGSDGDFYLDTASNVLYGPKLGGSWPTTGTSLVGPQGPQGPQGPAGQPGSASPVYQQIDQDSIIVTNSPIVVAFVGEGNNGADLPAGSYVVSANLEWQGFPGTTVDCVLLWPSSQGPNNQGFSTVQTLAPSMDTSVGFGSMSISGAITLSSTGYVQVLCAGLEPSDQVRTFGSRTVIATPVHGITS
jgi:hypothetical protein